jgi:FkbM family methyltransferase
MLGFSLINRRGIPIPTAVFDKLKDQFDRELTDDFGSENFLADYMVPTNGKCLIDVGASVGLWAIYAAKKGAEVHAFEPCPTAYNLLAKRAICHPNLHTYPYALGDVDATQKMTLSPYDIGAVMDQKQTQRIGAKTIDQTVRTLDSLKISNVGVLKIDTEGYEIPILKGAKKTIQKNKPLLLIEVHKDTGQAQKTFATELSRIQTLLKEYGYTYNVHYRPINLREMQPHIIAKPKNATSNIEFTMADSDAPTLYVSSGAT